MNEIEIITRWNTDRPAYDAWSKYVCDQISTDVKAIIHPQPLDEFLKVPVKPRLKDTKSLVDKALFRNKAYENPYIDITDKVGMRFVVLLTSDIRKVEQAICGSTHWTFSKDRDFEDERKEKPMEFAYQSVHYVGRCQERCRILLSRFGLSYCLALSRFLWVQGNHLWTIPVSEIT